MAAERPLASGSEIMAWRTAAVGSACSSSLSGGRGGGAAGRRLGPAPARWRAGVRVEVGGGASAGVRVGDHGLEDGGDGFGLFFFALGGEGWGGRCALGCELFEKGLARQRGRWTPDQVRGDDIGWPCASLIRHPGLDPGSTFFRTNIK